MKLRLRDWRNQSGGKVEANQGVIEVIYLNYSFFGDHWEPFWGILGEKKMILKSMVNPNSSNSTCLIREQG